MPCFCGGIDPSLDYKATGKSFSMPFVFGRYTNQFTFFFTNGGML